MFGNKIKLEKGLLERCKQVAEKLGYSSVDEFIAHTLEQELKDKEDISLGDTKVYIFKELNCDKADLNYDISRMINNIEVISIMVYQYMTTDILGKPLSE